MGLLDAIGGISAGLGLFGAMSGGDHADTSQYNQYMNQQQNAIGGLNAQAGQYGALGQTALGQSAAMDGQYQQGLGSYANYLKTNPFTTQFDTSAINQQTAGMNQGADAASSHLQSYLAARGFMNPSSMEAGGQTAIQMQRMGEGAAAQNNLASQKYNIEGQHQAALANLYGGAAQMYYGRGMGDMGAQSGLLGQTASMYGNLANTELQRIDAYNQQSNQTSAGLMGTGGSFLGYAQGMGG